MDLFVVKCFHSIFADDFSGNEFLGKERNNSSVSFFLFVCLFFFYQIVKRCQGCLLFFFFGKEKM